MVSHSLLFVLKANCTFLTGNGKSSFLIFVSSLFQITPLMVSLIPMVLNTIFMLIKPSEDSQNTYKLQIHISTYPFTITTLTSIGHLYHNSYQIEFSIPSSHPVCTFPMFSILENDINIGQNPGSHHLFLLLSHFQNSIHQQILNILHPIWISNSFTSLISTVPTLLQEKLISYPNCKIK